MDTLLRRIKRKQQVAEIKPHSDRKPIYAKLMKNLNSETTALSHIPVPPTVIQKLEAENFMKRMLEDVDTNTIFTNRKREQLQNRLEELKQQNDIHQQREKLYYNYKP